MPSVCLKCTAINVRLRPVSGCASSPATFRSAVPDCTRQRIGFGGVGLCMGGDIRGEGWVLAIKGRDGRGASSTDS